MSLTAQKSFILMQLSLSIFSFIAYVFGIISKNPLLNLRAYRFTSMFSSKTFIALVLTFSSLIHFELIFVYGLK
jgi:hypothetical protein